MTVCINGTFLVAICNIDVLSPSQDCGKPQCPASSIVRTASIETIPSGSAVQAGADIRACRLQKFDAECAG